MSADEAPVTAEGLREQIEAVIEDDHEDDGALAAIIVDRVVGPLMTELAETREQRDRAVRAWVRNIPAAGDPDDDVHRRMAEAIAAAAWAPPRDREPTENELAAHPIMLALTAGDRVYVEGATTALAAAAMSVRWEDNAATLAENAELRRRAEHAEGELSALRDHRARWQTEHERAERLRAELAEAHNLSGIRAKLLREAWDAHHDTMDERNALKAARSDVLCRMATTRAWAYRELTGDARSNVHRVIDHLWGILDPDRSIHPALAIPEGHEDALKAAEAERDALKAAIERVRALRERYATATCVGLIRENAVMDLDDALAALDAPETPGDGGRPICKCPPGCGCGHHHKTPGDA